MKAQASAALGVILVWLLGNNLAISTTISAPDLGDRTEEFLFKEVTPLLGQLALMALVGSAVIWLTGGLVRKLISGLNALVLIFTGVLATGIISNPAAELAEQVSLTGEVVDTSVSAISYVFVVVCFFAALLYLSSIRTYSGDRTRRPRLNTDRDTWRTQDEGKDGTV